MTIATVKSEDRTVQIADASGRIVEAIPEEFALVDRRA